MSIFYIETIGFCASTWLGKVLDGINGIQCVHGTKNFERPKPMGTDDVSEGEFVAQLVRNAQNTGSVSGAIHGKFSIGLRDLIRAKGGAYLLAVREPLPRILSCHSWMIAQIDDKRNIFSYDRTMQVLLGLYGRRSGFTMDDIIFASSVLFIIEYDYFFIEQSALGQEFVIKMEDYTSDRDYLGGLVSRISGGRFGIESVGLDIIEDGAINSHNTKKTGLEGLSANQREIYGVLMGNKPIKDMYAGIGYA